ncbi:hypothetical protein CJF60_00065 [Mycoplasmopsis agassizii]|uniref:Uncharacterized protein n=1 Tax=Mycoplasmopsis agassizii TaxID=33922 RepID=A0ABX4H595_9BACT|nr:hypothetical protein CJF60_00065 [Mycoplasmopsis agassizii]
MKAKAKHLKNKLNNLIIWPCFLFLKKQVFYFLNHKIFCFWNLQNKPNNFMPQLLVILFVKNKKH